MLITQLFITAIGSSTAKTSHRGYPRSGWRTVRHSLSSLTEVTRVLAKKSLAVLPSWKPIFERSPRAKSPVQRTGRNGNPSAPEAFRLGLPNAATDFAFSRASIQVLNFPGTFRFIIAVDECGPAPGKSRRGQLKNCV